MTRDFDYGVQETRTLWQDIPAEGIGLLAFQGRVVFDNGEVARCTGIEAIRQGEPGAPFFGALMLTLSDGSVGQQSFDCRIDHVDPDGTERGLGRWAWLPGGKRRLAGLLGGGPLDWRHGAEGWWARFSPDAR